VNLLQANGAGAGQSVPHLHIHIMPRRAGDGLVLNWEPKPRRQGRDRGGLQTAEGPSLASPVIRGEVARRAGRGRQQLRSSQIPDLKFSRIVCAAFPLRPAGTSPDDGGGKKGSLSSRHRVAALGDREPIALVLAETGRECSRSRRGYGRPCWSPHATPARCRARY